MVQLRKAESGRRIDKMRQAESYQEDGSVEEG